VALGQLEGGYLALGYADHVPDWSSFPLALRAVVMLFAWFLVQVSRRAHDSSPHERQGSERDSGREPLARSQHFHSVVERRVWSSPSTGLNDPIAPAMTHQQGVFAGSGGGRPTHPLDGGGPSRAGYRRRK
jgi:hypothetical protein